MDEFSANSEIICVRLSVGNYDVAYSIDKIEISLNIFPQSLKYHVALDELIDECMIFLILPLKTGAEHQRYNSKIVAIVPSVRFFQLLANSTLSKYAVSYIEIAKDLSKASESEAMFGSYRLFSEIRKRYTTKQQIADYRGSTESTKSANEEGKFSEQTGYFGGSSFEFVIYARDSKVTGECCVHTEWGIRGAGNIKKRTGIKSFHDLCEFDVGQCYENLTEKNIVHEKINLMRLGKWLLNYGRKRKFTDRQLRSVVLAAISFLSIREIDSAAQLADWFKKEKKRVKSKAGCRSSWDNKVLKLQSNSMFSDAVT